MIGDLNTHDRLIRYLAHYSGVNIIAVEYRLAPEAKFPDPINDAIDAWNWIVSNEDFLNQLIAFGPSKVVYVSCNPSTQMRDLRVLLDGLYAIDEVQPFDLFPHTKHLECVVTLSRS